MILNARLRIFDISNFKQFTEYSTLTFDQLDNYWTLNSGTPAIRDQSYIVLGTLTFDFIPDIVSSIDSQIQEFKKRFPYDNYRTELVEPRFAGSERMWHIATNLKRIV